MAKDLALTFDPRVMIDTSAAKGIASRRGVGKVRHLHVGTLWLQQAVHERRLRLQKGATGQGKCRRSRHETSCRANSGSLYPIGFSEGESGKERQRAADDDVAAYAARIRRLENRSYR